VASQPAPGRKKRNSFDQVGLARAIRPDQHHQIGGNVDLRGVIAAEVIEGEAADAGGGHAQAMNIIASRGTRELGACRSCPLPLRERAVLEVQHARMGEGLQPAPSPNPFC